jgi:hypothetical protein
VPRIWFAKYTRQRQRVREPGPMVRSIPLGRNEMKVPTWPHTRNLVAAVEERAAPVLGWKQRPSPDCTEFPGLNSDHSTRRALTEGVVLARNS